MDARLDWTELIHSAAEGPRWVAEALALIRRRAAVDKMNECID